MLAILASGPLVRAQTVPSMAEQQSRLERATAASKAAQEKSKQLEQAAEAARSQAAQARAKEEAAAQRIAAAEADIAAARARIAIVDRRLRAQRVTLSQRQSTILRLIAAIQSLVRRPPALGLVQPGSTEDIVHVRAVLGTTLPVVRERTADVRAELARIRGLRRQAEQAVASLRESRGRLEAERVALVHLEAENRLRSQRLDRSALIESDRAIAAGERARDIVDQMDVMEAAGEVREELAALPGPLPRPREAGEAAPVSHSAPRRAAPYRLPVSGSLVTGMGELSPTGVRSRGLTIATSPGAGVTAPSGGTIRYAAPFRRYGGVVIIDHGQGWTSLIAGLGAVSVKRGDTVAQGVPIGRAGEDETPRVTVELRRHDAPMDITRLLD
ncbi:peptidoglycan DD-metalloendopeptidase family protein [Sphingosinithalassobacter tenebrarum]|uniref:Peptidoglycan DD-metalloendopeptidase family protein n=2 Tax=Stakelama tenebrarum TaxID=2711215 RepID=A0A6G6Y9V5_9SPHN|nr:peptidoglycan DD-metalloendopeptidase family protein [Sphingosinithalassobacter tenebrarum]